MIHYFDPKIPLHLANLQKMMILLLLNLIVVLSAHNYNSLSKYQSIQATFWAKTQHGNQSIIDKYIPQGNGSINNFKNDQFFMTFSLSNNGNNTHQYLVEITAHFKQTLQIDHHLQNKTFSNIPIVIYVYQRISQLHHFDQNPIQKYVILGIISFSMQKLQFELAGSVYELELIITKKVEIDLLLLSMCIFRTFINTALNIGIGMVVFIQKSHLVFRFLFMWTLMAAYEMVIWIKLSQLKSLQQNAYLPISVVTFLIFISTCLLKLIIHYSKQNMAMIILAIINGLLIANGIIGEIFMFIQMVLVQALWTAINIQNNQRLKYSQQSRSNIIIGLKLILISVIANLLLFFFIYLCGQKQVYHYKYYSICLVFLNCIAVQLYTRLQGLSVQSILTDLFRFIKPRRRKLLSQEIEL